MEDPSSYPRPLTTRERSWLEWILPAERSGYRRYREFLAGAVVLGEGRRGPDELILGHPGDEPDLAGPLPAVIAYGAFETNAGTITVTLRDIEEDQASAEIVSDRAELPPAEFEETRRWTYSRWLPGTPCPQCRAPLREVGFRAANAQAPAFVLAICPADRRLWIHDAATGMCRLIPVTNFYNELMFHRHIRDPKVALESRRLFVDLSTYSDDDLRSAFERYNSLMAKVRMEGAVATDTAAPKSWVQSIIGRFRKP